MVSAFGPRIGKTALSGPRGREKPSFGNNLFGRKSPDFRWKAGVNRSGQETGVHPADSLESAAISRFSSRVLFRGVERDGVTVDVLG